MGPKIPVAWLASYGRGFFAALALLAPPALGEELPEPTAESTGDAVWSREGGWIGAGGAFALENFDRRGADDDSGADDSGALALRAGYRGLPNVAVELLGEVLPEFHRDGGPNVDGFVVTANGKLFLPLGRVEPWLMPGVGVLDIDRNGRREGFAFRFAGGLDTYLTPHVALYLEAAYLQPTGDVQDFAYATFGGGVLFRF